MALKGQEVEESSLDGSQLESTLGEAMLERVYRCYCETITGVVCKVSSSPQRAMNSPL